MSAELSNLLTKKIDGNSESIDILVERKPEIQGNIDLFKDITENIDNQIVSIVANINTLNTEIVTISNTAYNVGCGTTVGVSTVYPDVVRNYGFNLCSSSYDGDSPYDVTVSLLSGSNSGVGTYLIYTQGDLSQSGIGSLYGSINQCIRPLLSCNSAMCQGYSDSITAKQQEITNLRNSLTSLISSSNKIKTERIDYEIQRFGDNYTIRILNQENSRITSAITEIKNYS